MTPPLTARQLAAIRITGPFRLWLARYRIDAEIHARLTQEARENGSALSFEGDRPIVWRTITHQVYAIIARADGKDCFAIPRDAELPVEFK